MYTLDIRPCLRQTCVPQVDDPSCWTLPLNSSCGLDVSCKFGSTGPLCGACLQGYTFNSLRQECTPCDENTKHVRDLFIPYVSTGAALAAAGGLMYGGREIWRPLLHRLDQGRLRKLRRAIFNRAHLKTLYVTFQIVCSTSFTLDVTFPDIFSNYLEFLNVLTFDMFGTIR